MSSVAMATIVCKVNPHSSIRRLVPNPVLNPIASFRLARTSSRRLCSEHKCRNLSPKSKPLLIASATNATVVKDSGVDYSKPIEVKAVLFDMDGVLCNSEERSREAAVQLFHDLGYTSVTVDDFIPFMGTGEANFLGGVAALYNVQNFDPDAAKKRFFEIYIEKYATPNSGLGYPGALELILQCKQAGLKCAVASSADLIKVNANLSAAGLPQTNFDTIVTADKFERLKPAPDIFLAAAEALGVEPWQCVVIEDALAGVQAASSAGMRCIAVTTTLSKQTLESASPALVKPDISFITVDEIVGLRYAESTAVNSDVSEGFLDSPLTLPGGIVTSRRDLIRVTSLGVGLGTAAFAVTHLKDLIPAKFMADGGQVAKLKSYIAELDARGGGTTVPEFQSGLEWLNSPPLKIEKELRGKILLLDFWTYCCINCMHVLPDLAYLEKKYADQPVVVVGVHSAKFDNEKDSDAIRSAVLRYDVTHPVVNDGEMTMWRALGVSSWPTLALVGPTGKLIGMLAGEGHRQDLDDLIEASLQYYGEKGQLDDSPIPLSLEKSKDQRLVASPLKFPGKIATDLANGRLFISDSNNHRIVVTSLDGQFLLQVGGFHGDGFTDGEFESVTFNRPQGVAYNAAKNCLYVADTENHAIREIDFVSETAKTLAGTGEKGQDYKGGKIGTQQALNSPWDVLFDPKSNFLYVAMAGQHQIWRHDFDSKSTQVFSGTGYERNQNGVSGSTSAYAQPSGLSLSADGTEVFVADSESSSVRAVDLTSGGSRLLAGGDPYFSDNLFKFGDKDGVGSAAEFQHPLGVLSDENGNVLVADSYNHRIKSINLSTREVSSLAGNGKAGFRDGLGLNSQLSEPAGLARGPNGTIFVADTNNSLIRVFDPSNSEVSTLDLSSVPQAIIAPAGSVRPRRLRRRTNADVDVVKVDKLLTGGSGFLDISVTIPEGYHFTKGVTSRFEVDVEPTGGLKLNMTAGSFEQAGNVARAAIGFSISPELSGEVTVSISCKIYYCQRDEVCLYKGLTFEVPVSSSQQVEGSNPIRVPLLFSVPDSGVSTAFKFQ